MKYIKNFDSHRGKKTVTPIVTESVNVVDDTYKVRLTVDIPQALINSFSKKAKDTLGKNIKQHYSEIELAEEIAKEVLKKGLNIDNINPSFLFGEVKPADGTPQVTQPVDAVPAQPAAETAPVVSPESPEAAPEAEVTVTTDDNFEEVAGEKPEEENEELPEK